MAEGLTYMQLTLRPCSERLSCAQYCPPPAAYRVACYARPPSGTDVRPICTAGSTECQSVLIQPAYTTVTVLE